MGENLCRILILDIEQEAIIALEKALEQAGFDTTITWNPEEARRLLEGGYFDFVLLGDNPPELDAAVILRDLQRQSACGAYIVLSDSAASQVDRFGRLGVIAVIPKHDHSSVVELLGKHSQKSHVN